MTGLDRRLFIGALICAPAIVRASSLMRLKPILHQCNSGFCNHPSHFPPKTAEEIYADIIRGFAIAFQVPERYLLAHGDRVKILAVSDFVGFEAR